MHRVPFNIGLCLWALVGSKIVEDDDIAFRQRRSELGLDIGFEDGPVHWPVDDEGCGQAEASQSSDEGLSFPVSEWCFRAQPLAFRASTTQTRHLGGGSSFVDKHQAMGFKPHSRLAGKPSLARGCDVWTILLAGQ